MALPAKETSEMPSEIMEKRVLAFSALAMLPGVLFVLLFYVANHQ
jgi:hypothetical protein